MIVYGLLPSIRRQMCVIGHQGIPPPRPSKKIFVSTILQRYEIKNRFMAFSGKCRCKHFPLDKHDLLLEVCSASPGVMSFNTLYLISPLISRYKSNTNTYDCIGLLQETSLFPRFMLMRPFVSCYDMLLRHGFIPSRGQRILSSRQYGSLSFAMF